MLVTVINDFYAQDTSRRTVVNFSRWTPAEAHKRMELAVAWFEACGYIVTDLRKIHEDPDIELPGEQFEDLHWTQK